MTEHRIIPPAPSPADHLSASWVTAYAEGRLAPHLLGRAEPHLLRCGHCADAVETAVRRGGHAARLDALHRTLLTRVTGGSPPLPAPPPHRHRYGSAPQRASDTASRPGSPAPRSCGCPGSWPSPACPDWA